MVVTFRFTDKHGNAIDPYSEIGITPGPWDIELENHEGREVASVSVEARDICSLIHEDDEAHANALALRLVPKMIDCLRHVAFEIRSMEDMAKVDQLTDAHLRKRFFVIASTVESVLAEAIDDQVVMEAVEE